MVGNCLKSVLYSLKYKENTQFTASFPSSVGSVFNTALTGKAPSFNQQPQTKKHWHLYGKSASHEARWLAAWEREKMTPYTNLRNELGEK